MRSFRCSQLASPLALALAVALGGCGHFERAEREQQLQRVAKDWSMTIRASQVIPVYPMTEDLQPGDVFLVQQTVNVQHEVYMADGFLPLDNHIARLGVSKFDSFYHRSFFAGNGNAPTTMPALWLEPGKATSFGAAPTAAFPAYTFSVKKGAGFSGALPIQGVPVGLTLLGTATGTGSVTIKNARTYGIDMLSLYEDVQRWAKGNREFIAVFAGTRDGEQANYLRVISRVYLTGQLNVTVSSDDQSSAGVSAGVPKPVDITMTSAASGSAATITSESYVSGIAKLNDAMENAMKQVDEAKQVLPGATLKVASASARSISLEERFARPVVIGYLGFDIAILPGGYLGPPMPTSTVLERGMAPRAQATPEALLTMLERLQYQAADDPIATQAIADVNSIARKSLPLLYPVSIWSCGSDGELEKQIAQNSKLEAGKAALRSLLSYEHQLILSAQVLRNNGGGTPEHRRALDATEAELQRLKEVMLRISQRISAADEAMHSVM